MKLNIKQNNKIIKEKYKKQKKKENKLNRTDGENKDKQSMEQD